MTGRPTTDAVLRVEDLTTEFATDAGWVPAVQQVSFEVRPGETLGLVGESGCGKSVTARSIMRLLDERNTRFGGRVHYRDRDLLALPDKAMRQYRGKAISMIFQDPMTSLDPVFRIGSQIGEALRLHRGLKGRQARAEAVELLRRMGIPDAGRRVDSYPHELSGGMRQRVMIAMAVSSNPDVLLADEPTTALDVTTQAQILELLADLRRDLGMAMVFITHDLGIVSEICDRVAVMYLGRVVEQGTTDELFRRPAHPYTTGLMASAPSGAVRRARRLAVIPGRVPSLWDAPPGCRFAPRCPLADDRCRADEPPELEVTAGRTARCWHADQALRLGTELWQGAGREPESALAAEERPA